jgi:hypothetical protein
VGSEVLKAEAVDIDVLWDVAPGIVLEIAGVAEEHDTSINNNNNNIYLTAIGLSPGGSGCLTCIQI